MSDLSEMGRLVARAFELTERERLRAQARAKVLAEIFDCLNEAVVLATVHLIEARLEEQRRSHARLFLDAADEIGRPGLQERARAAL